MYSKISLEMLRKSTQASDNNNWYPGWTRSQIFQNMKQEYCWLDCGVWCLTIYEDLTLSRQLKDCAKEVTLARHITNDWVQNLYEYIHLLNPVWYLLMVSCNRSCIKKSMHNLYISLSLFCIYLGLSIKWINGRFISKNWSKMCKLFILKISAIICIWD
jgi:hypothetical protein